MAGSFVKLDHFVPLLTDTLPYETPFLFSNRGLYESIKKSYSSYFNELIKRKASGEKNVPEPLGVFDYFTKQYFSENCPGQLTNLISSSAKEDVTIPFTYSIKKNEFDTRTISLIHPYSQLQVCDLYKHHKETILFYGKRGPFSIRYPDRLTSRLVVKHATLLNKLFKDEDEANTADIKEKVVEDHEAISTAEIPNTFFVYEKYKKLHDFYESNEYLDLEKKFSYCGHLDVKRCFDSIYTHSIAWAVKGKAYIKKNLKKSKFSATFENDFDRLMQASNYGETHGIPIGAEVSRIFAEIILQRVDLDIQAAIENSARIHGKKPAKGRDYEIKRYIDDYFVFTNNKILFEDIQKLVEAALKEYKMFLNEFKSSGLITRPFTTNITAAKLKTVKAIYEHLKAYDTEAEGATKDKVLTKYVGYKKSLRLLKDLSCIVHDHKISFYDISNLCLAAVKIDALRKLAALQDLEPEILKVRQGIIRAYLRNIINITFYIFCSSARSHTCATVFKIGYIILAILELINDAALSGEIKQMLYSQFLIFFENIEASNYDNPAEFLDVIVFIKKLGSEFKIPKKRLKSIFGIEEDPAKILPKLSYFELAVLLSYIQNEAEYADIQSQIVELCAAKLSVEGLKRTENFLIFFDFIKCKYLTLDQKKSLVDAIGGLTKDKANIIKFIESKNWFFDWDQQEQLNLKDVLELKESSINY